MLKLTEATTLCNLVLQYGKEIKCNPLSVVVLDRGGHPLCIMRHEDAGIMRHDVAYGKAWGALGMGFGTRTFAGMAANGGKFAEFVQSLSTMSGGRVVPTQGGVLIRNQSGELIGSIGVSGDSSERDEECILYALKEMNLVAQP